MKRLQIIFLAGSLTLPAAAETVVIPTDYPTIQEGIDSRSDGDTVLVKPGIYYENINFNGHNIVVGSFFITNRNPGYIEETIIDGDSAGSVVTFANGEDSTAALVGLTIQNGYAHDGAGILCYNSSPVILNNIISGNLTHYSSQTHGGGIYCNFSSALIAGNTIELNRACFGAGICCFDSDSRITGNIIRHNNAAP